MEKPVCNTTNSKGESFTHDCLVVLMMHLGPRNTLLASGVSRAWLHASQSALLWEWLCRAERNARLRPKLELAITDGNVLDWKGLYVQSAKALKEERRVAYDEAVKQGEESDFALNFYGHDRYWDDFGKEATRQEFSWDYMS